MIPLEWKLNLWLALGIPAAVAWLLTVAILVRPATRKGLAWWVLPVVAAGVVAPLTWKFLLWLGHAMQPALYQFDRANQRVLAYWWTAPVGAVLIFAAGASVWLWRRERERQAELSLPELPAPQIAAQPVQIWSAPTTGQWDADRFQR